MKQEPHWRDSWINLKISPDVLIKGEDYSEEEIVGAIM